MMHTKRTTRKASRQARPFCLAAIALATTPALAATGSLDATFGDRGYVDLQLPAFQWVMASSVVEQDDGKIVAAGTFRRDRDAATGLIVARFESNGRLDATFGNGGYVTGTNTGDVGSAVAQQADGRLLVAGMADGRAAMWRFTPDGLADAGFGTGGAVHLDLDVMVTSAGIVEQAGGRLVTAFSTRDAADPRLQVIRLNSDGSTDASFGEGGVLALGTGVVLSLREQADGHLLLLHSWDSSIAVTRLHPDGTLDQAFGEAGTVRVPVSGLDEYAFDGDLAVRSDGRIAVAAHVGTDFWFYSEPRGLVLQLLPDGSLDSSFGDNGQVMTDVERGASFQGVAVAPDGGIYAGGTYVSEPPPPGQTIAWDFALTRFRPDGTLDTDFASSGQLVADFSTHDTRRYSFADTMTMQSDGRIVLAGNAFGGPESRGMALVRIDAGGAGSAGTIRASELRLSTTEGAGLVEVSLTRIGGSSGDVVINYETADASASAGTDYVAAAGDLAWTDGDFAEKSLWIEILDDDEAENQETFEVRFRVASGGADLALGVTEIAIVDDDQTESPATLTGAAGGGSVGVGFLLMLIFPFARRLVRTQNSCVHRAYTIAPRGSCSDSPVQV